MARPTKKMTTTANGAVVSGQEDLTKLKNLTPKATQSAEKSASDKAMDELVALDQELGLYNITTNPLIKSDSAIEAVEGVQQEINTTVAPEANIAVIEAQEATEGVTEYFLPVGITISEPTNDAQYVKDGWDRPVLTKVVTIKKSYLRETVEEALYIANLGGALDTTFLPTMTCPFICRMLIPEANYQEYLERKSQIGYDESQVGGYNEVLVKGVDRSTFWKNLVKVGNAGGFLLPNSQPTRAPQFTAKLLTRKPVLDTINTQLKPKKAIYTREELESFSIEDLHIVGEWYNLSFNSKQKYVKAIIEIQESKL